MLEERRTTGGGLAHIQTKPPLPAEIWLTPADWAVWAVAQLSDLQFDWVSDCVADWHTDSLSVWLPVLLSVPLLVCLTGRPAGWVYLEALMFRWLHSFLTWTHKGFCTQTEVCCYTTPSSLHARRIICNTLKVHTSTQSSLSDVCRLWFSWSAFWHSSIELFSTYTGIHADQRQIDETHMQILPLWLLLLFNFLRVR